MDVYTVEVGRIIGVSVEPFSDSELKIKYFP
jgi:hypothetical protein